MSKGWSSNRRKTAVKRRFQEEGAWSEGHWFEVTETLHASKTKFQSVEILQTPEYGVLVVLDGHTQSAEDDEYIYHEALVQPAMAAHGKVRSALVIGGGEGATLREIFRHPSVDRVVMVDIDGGFVELCKKLLPQWHQGAFDDPRLELVIGDGKKYIETGDEKFDLIILDVVDAFDEGPATELYTRAFYKAVKRRLKPGGILAIQAMELAGTAFDDHKRVRQELSHVFRHMRSYNCFVPSFWCEWGYILATDARDPVALTPDRIDAFLKRRGVAAELRFYDGSTHRRMFALPRDLSLALASKFAAPRKYG